MGVIKMLLIWIITLIIGVFIMALSELLGLNTLNHGLAGIAAGLWIIMGFMYGWDKREG